MTKKILFSIIGGVLILVVVGLLFVGFKESAPKGGEEVLVPEKIIETPKGAPVETKKEIAESELIEKIPSNWKTYRNEEYGFEIDYSAIGWEFKESSRGGPYLFSLCRQKNRGQRKKETFCILATIEWLSSECFDYNWKEIMENAYVCFMEQIYDVHFEKEITTDFGAKGYQGRRFPGRPGEIVGVFFPIPIELKEGDFGRPIFFLKYYLNSNYGREEIEAFNQMLSTFRFIKK